MKNLKNYQEAISNYNKERPHIIGPFLPKISSSKMQSDLASSRNTFNSLVSILFTSIQARMLIKLAVIKVEECQKKKLVWINFYFFFGECWTELHLYMFDLKISSLDNIDLLLLFKNSLLFLDFKEIYTLFFLTQYGLGFYRFES